MKFTNENLYCFDDVTIDCENFRVQKDGQKVTLTPRAFDVLIFLMKNGERVIEKQELFEQIWKDTFVTNNALTKIIKEIRHALEDSADEPRYIETISKRGYRFIGKIKEKSNYSLLEPAGIQNGQIIVSEINEPGRGTVQSLAKTLAPRFAFFSKTVASLLITGLISISVLVVWLLFWNKPAQSSSLPIRSIAVLPFKPLNADSRDESLEMGMAETLITRLSNLNQIAVRPMNAVSKYRELQQDPVKTGQEIQVEAILDGSIQKAGERIRITVRLINVRNGITLWSEQFDENFTDIFKVQDSIAERVTNALTLQLSRQEKEQIAKHVTDNPEAYQLYLRGQFLWHRRQQDWIEQSLAYYRQALEKDPDFALAHIGVADCYMMLNGHQRMSVQEAEMKARPSIMKALEIDNNLAQAHNALAELKYQYEYDWNGAEKEFKRAIELNPNIAWIRQAYGWFLMSEGRFDEAATEMDKALQLDSSSLTVNIGRGRLYYFSRQYDQAIQQFQNILAVEPNDASAYYALYTVYEQKQMYSEAVELFLKSMNLNGAPPQRVEEFREAFRVGGWPGFLNKHLEKLEKRAKTQVIEPFAFAHLYVRLGRKEEALIYLQKSFEQHHSSVIQFKIEPAYDSLRDDPRFAELIQKIGL